MCKDEEPSVEAERLFGSQCSFLSTCSGPFFHLCCGHLVPCSTAGFHHTLLNANTHVGKKDIRLDSKRVQEVT